MGNIPPNRDRNELEQPEAKSFIDGSVVITHQGMRGYQEDSFDFKYLELSKTCSLSLYGVYDGHGGTGASNYCTKKLLKNISNRLCFDSLSLESSECMEKLLKDVFVTTERDLFTDDFSEHSPSAVLEESEDCDRILATLESPTGGGGKPSGGSSPSLLSPFSKPFTPKSLQEPSLESTPTTTNEFATKEDPGSTSLLNLKILAPRWSSDDGSGACALVCIKTPKYLVFANAGDCRALLVRKDKSFEILVDEHKASDELEQARIKNAGLYVDNERVIGELLVSRSIGDFKYKGKPKDEVFQAVSCVPFTRTLIIDESFAYVLLMSDGIVDGITMEELSQILFEESELEKKVTKIINHCLLEDHSYDNMTLFAISF
jgi:serine/threonine protein phosphatase PrpC